MEILKTLNNTTWIKEIESKGRIFLVGGFVRDMILGKPSKDIDMVVEGIELSDLVAILKKHGKTDLVGESFAVIKFKDPNIKDDFDIAVCRTDRKVGDGHKGFEITSDASITIDEDLFRRDFTINSIAVDMQGNFLDPFDGRKDIANGIIAATNNDAFADDPLRILRGVQFASRFGFDFQPGTLTQMANHVESLKEISGERILEEFSKIVSKGSAEHAFNTMNSIGIHKAFGFHLDNFIFDSEVKTLGDFMFLMLKDLPNGRKFLADRFKADNVTKAQFDVIHMLHNDIDETMPAVLIAAALVKKSPEAFNIGMVGEDVKNALNSMECGHIPARVTDLEISGNDLMEIGLQGPVIGKTLSFLHESVLLRKIPNDKDTLLRVAANATSQGVNQMEKSIAHEKKVIQNYFSENIKML